MLCEWLDIKESFSTVYQPQPNGQVEAVNKVIKQTLKKKFDVIKGGDELLEVLWSYRTMARSSMGETPFSLAYGCEAMASVEVRVGSFQEELFDDDINEALMCQMLDFIDEHRAKS